MNTSSAKPKLRTIGIRDVVFGANVTVVEPANLYECEIGANSFVGPFVEIQSGVRIGCGCRIQSHSFICEMVTIGDYSTIAHGVMFINDPFTNGGPARGDKAAWRETIIGDRVSIGSNATILPVKICSDVVIGAGAVVTHNIIESGVYAGNPARKLR
jgi:acetyltransferase-like isoleucine patch superfamily enzyme